MDLRPLGATGMLVSPLGLGTVKFGRNRAVKYPRPFDLPSDEDALALLDLARTLGINLLDTAPAYGTSEERLGALLAGRRDEWIISTKVGEEFDPATGLSRFDFSPDAVRASVDRSLRRLRTDRLDIVLVHSDGDERAVDQSRPKSAAPGPLDALDALARPKQEGKIRAIGISPKTPAGALAAMQRSDVLMLTLNPREPQMLPVVRQSAGVGVLIKKALISGHLESEGSLSPHDCLRFAFAQPNVAAAVVGTIDPKHLREDAEAAERVLG